MRRNFHLLVLLFCCIALIGTACKQEDLTPAYLQIDYEDVNDCIDISNFNDTHGTNYDVEELEAFTQHDFSHVNVYIDGKNFGCWELPCKVPVLDVQEGDSSQVIVLPCFRKTGMANTIQGYPFLNILQKNLLLEKGKTFDLSIDPPTYIYNPYVQVPYLETFSNSSSFLPNDTLHNYLTFLPTQYDGRNVGELVLNDENGLNFDVVVPNITVPTRGHYVYLEMTYNIENSLEIGMKLSTATFTNVVHQLGGIYKTDGKWKTIYFDLSSVISGYHATGQDETKMSLIFTGLGDKGKETRFSVDNIKVIVLKSA